MKSLRLFYFLSVWLFISVALNSQAQVRQKSDVFNKLSIEIQGGFDFPFKPTYRYITSEGDTLSSNMNNYNGFGGQIGLRYMLNSHLGIRPHYAYHYMFTDLGGTFLRFHRYGVEAVYSLSEFYEPSRFYEYRRWNFLVHAGGGITHAFPSELTEDLTYKGIMHEDIWSLMVGVTPQYHFKKNLIIYADISLHASTQQNYGYHGTFLSEVPATGWFLTTSFGIQIPFGNKDKHIDWR